MENNKNAGKKLIKNTMIIGVGQLCAKFLSIILLPIYTSSLNPNELGIIDLIIAYASLVQPILYLQIDQAIFRFLISYRGDEEKRRGLISIGILIFFIQSLILGLVCFTAINLFGFKYAWLLGLYSFFSTFQTLLLQIARGCGFNGVYSIASIIYSVFVFGLTFYFVGFKALSIDLYFIINFVSFAASILFMSVKLGYVKHLKIKNDKNKIKEIIKYSLPLVPNALSWWMISVSDRTIIKIFIGDDANGIYSISNKFTNILSSMLSVFVLSWTESAAENIGNKNRDKYFTAVLTESYKVIMALSNLIISALPFVFYIFVKNEQYNDAYWQIPILIISVAFNAFVSILGSIYVALKKTKEIAKTSIYCAIINIFVNIGLIKMIGLSAASLSTLIAFLSMTIYRLIDLRKYINIQISLTKIMVPILMNIIVLVVFYLGNRLLLYINVVISVSFTIKVVSRYFLNIRKKLKP